jgi:type VI secretion system protein ImpK
MVDDDPFASLGHDQTVIKPSPGGRAPSPASSGQPAVSLGPVEPLELGATTGLNPLLAAANPLLNAVSQIRGTLTHPNPAGLREQLAVAIRNFESRARASGIAPEKVIAARYALCTLLDEAAASTPWGGSGSWANHSLLVLFHNETWGGEKFFQLLSKLAENPAANRDLLELMYACLALGFEGRYRVLENGRAQLETLRERLAQLLRQQAGEFERDLSPHWQGVVPPSRSILATVPLWIGAALCGLAVFGAYFWFSYALNNASDPVYAEIQSIRVQTPMPRERAPAPAPAPVAKPRLAQFLATEIAQGQVAVREQLSKSVITLGGDGLFAPGSDTVSEAAIPVLLRVADALNSVPGKVLVTGHTDNVPIRTVRFPSNWHLSQARANTVMRLLATRVTPARLSAEGRAESEPVAANDSPANRARNRRVEITLFVAPESQ